MSDINSVNLSHESKFLLYADDILLYQSVTSGNDYKFLQEDIDSLSAWCNSTISLSMNRSVSLWWCQEKERDVFFQTLLLNGHHTEESNILALTSPSDLMWSRHVQLVSQRARRLVGLLYRQFYQYADTNTMKHLYLLLIHPHLEYACTVWDPFLQKIFSCWRNLRQKYAQSNGTGAMKSCCILYNYLHSETQENETRFAL